MYTVNCRHLNFGMHVFATHDAIGYVASLPLRSGQLPPQESYHHTDTIPALYQALLTYTSKHIVVCTHVLRTKKDMPQRRIRAVSCCLCTELRNLATADCTQMVAEKGGALRCHHLSLLSLVCSLQLPESYFLCTSKMYTEASTARQQVPVQHFAFTKSV